jgi:hypothetical protein
MITEFLGYAPIWIRDNLTPSNPGRLREEEERRKSRRAGAVLVRNNRKTEMGNAVEIKALFFALIGGSSRAEIVFLNQNLAVGSSSVLRDFNAHFLGTLARRLFDFVHETRDPLRSVEFQYDVLGGIGARAYPTCGSRAGLSVEQVFNQVSRIFG